MLSKPLDTTHFDRMLSGEKTCEGRPTEKIAEWRVSKGDKMKFIDANDASRQIIVKIVDITRHDDFGEAFDKYGEALVLGTRETAIALYAKYPGYTDMVAGRGPKEIPGASVLVIEVVESTE